MKRRELFALRNVIDRPYEAILISRHSSQLQPIRLSGSNLPRSLDALYKTHTHNAVASLALPPQIIQSLEKQPHPYFS
jgi:hypothetical protein